MDITLEPDRYVVAVSGGVDSVVLLDILSKISGLQLIVAHFDHGIRPESADDAQFVAGQAQKYGLEYYGEREELGANASEALARKRRYAFLERVRETTNAAAIVTAHHQDDVIETAVINMLRGTGRRGITSLDTSRDIIRPLLTLPKQEIVNYAQQNGLLWREDATNSSDAYLRNRVRRRLENADHGTRAQLLAIVERLRGQNNEIDQLLMSGWSKELALDVVPRSVFNSQPYAISCELIMCWLRARNIQYDKKLVHRLSVMSRVATPGTVHDIDRDNVVVCSAKQISMQKRSSV